jgi:nucleobase:cation symporter-1, NCS1 family
MCYFIYWLLQFPFMLVSPQRIRYLFTAKAIIVPIAWIAMLIWAMVKVPPSVSLAAKESTVGGSTFSWAWLGSLNSALGIYATLAVNIPDFTVSATSEVEAVADSPFCHLSRDMQRMRGREHLAGFFSSVILIETL